MTRHSLASSVALMALLAAWPAAANPPASSADKVANVEPSAAVTTPALPLVEPWLGTSVRDRLGATASKLAEPDRAERSALTQFYEARGGEPLWVARTGLNAKGAALAAELRQAEDWGLRAADFDVPNIAKATDGGAELAKDVLADAEAKLSLAALRYARHAAGGRITEPTTALSSYLDRKPDLPEPKTVLDGLAAATDPDAFLRGLHPKHAEFEALRQQLIALRGEVSAKAATKVPLGGPKLAPGARHADVAIIRQRLKVAAPYVDGVESADVYDDALAAAVKTFQAEKGIKPANGSIGSSTRAALNETAPAISTRKLLANMEQWRWMPRDLGDLHVWVNIPEYTVRVVKNGRVIHTERVITGKIDTQTPIFSDSMETVVIHPFWGVPESIKVKEVWPSLVRGGGMLSKNGLKLQRNGKDIEPHEVDWTTADIRNFHVYQPPGGGNVLGVVKFLFPNKHQVYMHDTPTKHLFNTAQRTYSHGCMRVRNPVRLAEVILAEDKGWSPDRIAGLIRSGPQNNEIVLDRKVPVHVTYFTAKTDDDGKVAALRDIYGHEERITLALDGKWNQIARGRDHLAPVKAEPIARLAEGRPSAQPQNALGDFFKNLFGGF